MMLAALAVARPAAAQLFRQHTVRYQTNDAGEIILRGNTLTTCTASAACTTAQNHTGAVTTATGSLDNNAYTIVHVDVDGDPSTFNSSRSSLTIPSGGQVLWAGLYWAGRTANTQRNTIRFRTPASGGYVTLTAQQVDNSGTDYQAFREVTGLVQAGGSGQYTGANVFTTVGSNNNYAGWSLVVVLRNPARPLRNLSVFDGFANISGSSSVNVTVSGFLTPALGTPNTIVGIITYEGDRGIVGDRMLVNGVDQSNSLNALSNFHTGTIADTTTYVTAGQQPAYTNQLGLDIKTFRTTQVPAGATSAQLRFTTTGDQYYPGVVTFQTDLFNPVINGNVVKSVYDKNGGVITSVSPGDTLRYDIQVANTGQDGSLNTTLIDTIPDGVTYVPGSIQIVSGSNPGAKTDLAADDQAELLSSPARVRIRLGTGANATTGGTLTPSATTRIRFRVRINDVTPAGFTIRNQAYVTATSQTLGQPVNAASRDSTETAATGAAGGTPPTPMTVVGPNLTIAKTVAGDIPRGGPGSFTITVSNAGSLASSSTIPVVVVDTLIAGVTPLSASGTGWSCGIAGQIVTCTRTGAIAANAAAPPITLNVTTAVTAPASFTNRAWVSGGGDNTPANNSGSVLAVTVGVPDFTITKTVLSATPFVIGTAAQYRLRVRNVGSAANGTDLEIRDTLAAGLTFGSGTGTDFTCTANGSAVTCVRPGTSPIPAGDSVDVTLVVNVGTAAAPSVTNAARVFNSDDPNAGNNRSATAATPVIADPDLELTKTAVGVFTVGQNATYRLRVRHVSPSPTAPLITVTDSLGAGLSFIAATGGGFACSNVGSVVTCTRTTSLSAGDSAIITFTVNVSTAALPNAYNKAWVVTAGDGNASNDTTIVAATQVAGVPDLNVTKTAAAPLPIGQQGSFTITVTNGGTAATTDSIIVADTLPATLTFASASGPGFTCSFAAPVARCVRTTPLTPGASAQVTLNVTATVAALPQITNRVTVQTAGDANPADNLFTLPNVPVVSVPDLSIAKTSSGAMTIGQAATYTLTVTNVSPGPTTGTITVQDSLAAGLSFTSASGAGFTCGAAGALVTCTRAAALAAGASVPITLTVTPSGAIAASVTNLARVSTPGDVNAFNDTVVTLPRTVQRPNLSITKSHTGNFTALDTLGTVTHTYTIQVANTGAAETTGPITVIDSLPAQVQYVGTPSGGWACVASGVLTTGRVVTCTNPGPIAPSGVATLELTVTARPLAAGNVTNIARVSTPNDVDTANDRATDPTTIVAAPDLQLFKSNNRTTAASPVPFQVGASGQTFTLTVTNIGAGATTAAVLIRDTLPQGILFGSATGGSFTCAVLDSLAGVSPRRQIVECTRAAALAAGATAAVDLTVTVDQSAVPSVTNRARVSTAGDPNPDNDAAVDAPTPVVNPVDLTITKAPQGAFTVGSNATFLVTVTNLGTGTATSATTVTDTLAPGFTFVSGTNSAGFTCSVTATLSSPTRQVVTCTRAGGGPSGTLGVQGSGSYAINLVVSVAASALPTQVNRIWVSNPTDQNATNDVFETGALSVVSPIDLRLSKSPVGAVIAGGTTAFNFSIANLGANSTTGAITITDTLPVGLTLVSSTGGGFNACTTTDSVPGPSPRRRIIQCVRPAAPALTSGEDVVVTMTTAVSGAAFPSIQNRATVSTAGDVNALNDTASTAVLAVTSVPDFSIVKTGASPLSVGLPSPFTLTIANVSPVGPSGNTSPLVITDTLPIGFTFDAAATAANTLTAASQFTCGAVTIAGPRDVVTCTRPATVPVTQGQEVQLVLLTQVTSAAVGNVANTAWLATAGDLNVGNNSSTTSVLAVVVPDLTVAKSVTPATLVRGQPAQYTVTVTNGGSGPTIGAITMTDAMPAGVAFVSVAEPEWSCAATGDVSTGQTVTCTRTAPLAPAASAVATLAVTVTPAAPSTVSNSVTVATPSELNTGNNSTTLAGTPVVSAPDLALSSTVVGTWVRNVPAVLRLVATNVGTGPTTGPTTIVTTLPTGVTFGSAPPGWTCAVVGQTLTCVNPAVVPAGDSLPLDLTLALGPTAGSSVSLPSTVTTAGDPRASNDAATAVATVASAADLRVVKQAVGSFIAGQSATYRVSVLNIGSAPTTGTITLTDTLAPTIGYVLGTGGGFGCTASGQIVTCSRETPLAAGDSAVLSLNVNLSSGAPSTLTNAVRVSTPGDASAANDTGSTGAVAVSTAPDLALSGTVQGPALGGQPVNVIFNPVNQGSATTTGTTTLVTTLPAGATFTGSVGAGWTCSQSGQQVTCTTTAAIPPGGSAPVTLTVTLPVAPPNPVSFPSTVTTAGDANPANSAANPSAAVGLVPDAALEIAAIGTPTGGQQGTLRFTATNVGGAATSDSLRIVTTLPPGVTFVASATPGWTCSAVGQVVTCRQLTPPEAVLAPGASRTLDLTVAYAGSLVGVVPVSGTVATTADPNASNNVASASLALTSSPDLALAATINTALVAGQSTNVTFTATNVGPASTLGSRSVAITVPNGVIWNGVNPPGVTCSLAFPTLSCVSAATVGVSASSAFTLGFTLAQGLPAAPLTFVGVSATSGDGVAANDTASVSATVSVVPELSLNSTFVGPVIAGQSATLRLTPINGGGSAPTSGSTTVAVTLPATLTWNGTNPAGYTCTFAAPTLSCVTPTAIAVGDSLPLVIGVNVAASATGAIAVPATVTAAGDPVAANNASTANATVTTAPDIALSAAVVGTITAGQPATLRVVPLNSGSASAPGTSVAVTLPTGMTWNGTNPAGYSCSVTGAVLTCVTTTPIAVGDSLPFTIGVNTTPALTGPLAIPATATTTGDPNAANDSATIAAPVATAPDVELTGTAGPFVAGQPGTLRYVPRNIGSAVTGGVVAVVVTLPSGITWNGVNPPGYSCAAVGATLTCTSTTPIAVGDSLPMTIGVNTAPTLTGPVVIPATASAPGDPNPANDSASPSATVGAAPDLALAGGVVGPVIAGQPVTVRLVPRNAGSQPASGATVTVTIPTGTNWNGINPPGYACTLTGATLSCVTTTPLAPGDSLPLTVTLTSSPTLTGPLSVPATVSTAGDPNPVNNATTLGAPVGTAPDVALTGTAGPFVAGQSGPLRYVPRNIGSAATSGAVPVAITLPTGVTWNGINPPGYSCTLTGSTLTCVTTTPIAPGDSLPFTVTVTVPLGSPATTTFPATVTAPGDPNAANDSAAPSATIANAPDLAVTIAGDPLIVSQPGTVRLGLRNVGGAATTGTTTLTTILPAGVTYTGATTPAGWSCSASGQTVTCTSSAPIAPSDSVGIVVSVATSAAAAPSATVTTTVSTPGDGVAANDAASVTLPVSTAPDLTLTTRTPGPLIVGRPGATTVTGTNRGSAPTSGPTVITTTLPPGTTFRGANGPGFTCSAAGQVVTCTRSAPVAPGDSTGVVVEYDVDPAAQPGVTIPSVGGTPGDPNPANDGATATIPVVVAPDLTMTKAAVGVFRVGAAATYTLTISNVGSGATTAPIVVTDSLPATLEFLSASGTDFACVAAASVVTCERSTPLAPNASVVVTVLTRPLEGALPQVVNVARASTAGDPDTGNDRATVTTPVGGVRDIAITKTGADTVSVGGQATWQIGVLNNGSLTIAAPITVIDSLPRGVTFTSATGAGWTCTHVATSGAVSGVVSCRRDTALLPGASAPITVSAAVTAAAFPGVINRVHTDVVDDDATNNRATKASAVSGTVDLVLRKQASQTALTAGLTGGFVLTVQNLGTIPTQGPVTVVDSLPSAFTFESGTGQDWSCTLTAPTVSCVRSTPLAPGDSSAVTIGVRVGALASGTITNVAVASTALETNLANNRGTAAVQVTGEYRLAVEKTSGGQNVAIGGTNDYTIVVRNIGASPVPDVRVTDNLPRGFLLVAGSTRVDGVASADPAGAPAPTLAFSLGSLAPGAERRITYRTRITAQVQEGRSVNTATASSGVVGVNVAANSAAAPVQVRRSIFSDRGVVVGKVFARCDCADRGLQSATELGVPGVRVVMEDGTAAITDVEGKFNFWDVPSGLHVLRVDASTLPPGTRLVPMGNRNARDGASRFVDLKQGELQVADFALASDADVYDAVQARRRGGEPTAASTAAPVVAIADSTPQPVGSLRGRLEITTGRVQHPADGVSRIPVRVRLLDAAGQPVSGRTSAQLEASLGAWVGAGPLDATLSGPQVELVDGVGEFTLTAPGVPGQGKIRVTTSQADGTVPVQFVPAARPFFLTGLLQGRLDQRLFSRGDLSQSLGDRFERQLTAAAFGGDTGSTRGGVRGAVYAKGTVFGDRLLTLGWDSERNPDRTQFRDIDPDLMFPTYGDASLREFDAQSRQRFYARMDAGRSFATFGDFQTQRAGESRLLGAWDRSLTGAQWHAESDRGVANVYAARTGIRQFVEELPGRGLSGPYLLTRLPLINSERVELITRDRNQPSLILKQRPMQRFADYVQESGTNRLVFRAPVPSLDEQFNPISVRVTYEVEEVGTWATTAGTDAQLRLGRLEVGGVLAFDGNPTDSLQLRAANASWRLGANTIAIGEFAQTRTMGGVSGDASRAELRHASAGMEWRLYAMRTDAGFQNRSSALGIGRQELGGRVAASIGGGRRLLAEALQTEDLLTGGRRRGASIGLEQKVNRWLRLEGGYRRADETGAPALATSLGIVPPPNFSAYRGRATLTPWSRSSFFGEIERGSGTDISRWSVGAEQQLPGRARLYARHEELDGISGPYGMTRGQFQANTVVGLDADWIRNSQLFSEYRARDAFNGRDAEASMGLRNRWAVARGLLINTSFERVAPVASSVTSARRNQTAVAGAFEWTSLETTKLTGRAEVREGDGRSWLGSFGLAQKLSRDWTFLARSLFDETPAARTDRWRTHAGFAWRQTDTNRWNALFRYEHLRDRSPGTTTPAADSRSERHLLHALANVKATTRVTLTGRLAAQWQELTADGLTTMTASQLVYGRAIYDVTDVWDAGLIASTVLSEGARQRQMNVGVEIGRLVTDNARLALGVNSHGYTDRVANAFGYTARGVYLDFGFKFDESLFTGRRRPATSASGRSK
jgi:uncharacterized repeat protein (TIGR01451 family)